MNIGPSTPAPLRSARTIIRRAGAILAAAAAAMLSSGSLPAAAAEPSADGLYAGFTTRLGSFWCRLDFDKAPRTVANFVSLAEGTRDWIDFKSARIVRRPFHTGIGFHRIISGFMVQGGSPNGLGNDGPGYRFADEFHPELRHTRPGTLSMANSGRNSNGSQFFITVTNTPWLDNLHSVFGEVVDGMDIVYAISAVPTDLNDRPTEPVIIQDLRILRVGAAAQAFDPAAVTPPLPAVGVIPISLQTTPDSLAVLLRTRSNHIQHVFFGSDFNTWTAQSFLGTPTNLNASSLRGFSHFFFKALDGGLEP